MHKHIDANIGPIKLAFMGAAAENVSDPVIVSGLK